MRWFVVGYDHGFGRDREASPNDLRRYAEELGFSLEIVEPVVREGTPVKSSVIRDMVRRGDIEGASELLGREYSLRGIVVHGTGMGRIIGVPTANIQPDVPEKLAPGAGVYAGWAVRDSRRAPCVISIGPRPTFGIAEETIEAHIPGFHGDLYGKHLRIEFSRKLREIIRFESSEALVEQIQRDIETLHHLIVS
jgi:riboflavin kinase/FMN adenylyltransferase